MRYSSELAAVVAATLLTSSLAAPPPPVAVPSPVKCNDPTTGVTELCWDKLKAGDYIQRWANLNFPKTCKAGEAWSVCFDRLATNNLHQDCTAINSTKCAPFNDPIFHYLSPQWFYGAYNTWSINKFFTAYYNAIDFLGKSNPASINSAAKPNDFDEFTAFNNNNRVSIDVALKNLIALANKGKSNQNAALIAVLDTLPSSVKYDSSKVDTAKPSIAELLKARLEGLLKHVESDVDAFVAFAAKGAFSTTFITRNETLVDAWWPEHAARTSVIE